MSILCWEPIEFSFWGWGINGKLLYVQLQTMLFIFFTFIHSPLSSKMFIHFEVPPCILWLVSNICLLPTKHITQTTEWSFPLQGYSTGSLSLTQLLISSQFIDTECTWDLVFLSNWLIIKRNIEGLSWINGIGRQFPSLTMLH